MKFCRFVPLDSVGSNSSSPHYGLLEGESVQEISGLPWTKWLPISRTWRVADVRLIAPVDPSKIVCIGRNYAAHAAELGNEVPKEPLMFLKPPSSLIGMGEPILLPPYSQRVEHEGELAVVIGRRCSRLPDSDDPLAYAFGYTCLNDVTARDLQKSDVQFTRAKGFDTFCSVGPLIETSLDLHSATIQTFVNGQRKQSAAVSEMIFPVDVIIRWVSRMMTLLAGDIISTG